MHKTKFETFSGNGIFVQLDDHDFCSHCVLCAYSNENDWVHWRFQFISDQTTSARHCCAHWTLNNKQRTLYVVHKCRVKKMISVNILIPSTRKKLKRRNGSFEAFYSPGKGDAIKMLKGDKNDG